MSEGERSYGTVARTIHWLIFILISAQMAVGWLMPHIRKTTPQEGLVDVHLSLGATIMALVLIRIVWRITHPVPLSPTLAPWERIAAKIVHELLYLLLLVIPILGWASSGYYGYTAHLFGIPLPVFTDGTMKWAHDAGDVHKTLTYVLLGLVGLHVLGALWHYVVRRDRVLQRMLPWLR